ncbi:MAG: coniferyl aldehyde dehydrogenase [Xanthobacteraceae bacterium]|nr:coniferyl aldehyde dehydrogenase [Xanthobacteraceae bacterium]
MLVKIPAAVPEMRAVFDAQRAAFLRAGAPSLQERRTDLTKLGEAIKQSAGRLAEAISADFGNRSRHETALGEIMPVQSAIRHTLRHLPGWMRPKRVSVGLELMPAGARILYQPVGVVGIISPWNYPLNLSIVPLIAALAAGNRVMLKPSELTPRTSDFLAELLGGLFPSDKVATVVGGPDTGQAFARLPFDHLLYTGSTAVGRLVMQAAAENLTPVTLELGGKSPCILGEDASLPGAVESIVYGKLVNAGQTCIAPDYVLLPEPRLDEFITLTVDTVEKFYPTLAGNPDYTSMVNDRHYRRVAQYIAEAKANGARVIEINPKRETLPAEGRKLAPTLVIEPGDNLSIMRDEIFGPVLPVKNYRSLDQAIDYVNAHPRPLALYYFGTDQAKRDKVLRKTVSGGASVNTTLFHFAAENLPFGGIGPSGIGAYHGEFGFQTFSHRKGVFLQSRFNAARFLYPPFGRITDLMLKFLTRG